MQAVLNFLENLFSIEQEVLSLRRKRDIERYNQKFNDLLALSLNQSVKFGLGYLDQPKSDSYYAEIQQTRSPAQRKAFKVTRYTNSKYGDLWACYVSGKNPKPNINVISECLVVASIDSHYQVIASYVFGDPDLAKSYWIFAGGDEELKMDQLGDVVEILRLTPPSDDADSLAEYEKDK
jgi:hypothetical protein